MQVLLRPGLARGFGRRMRCPRGFELAADDLARVGREVVPDPSAKSWSEFGHADSPSLATILSISLRCMSSLRVRRGWSRTPRLRSCSAPNPRAQASCSAWFRLAWARCWGLVAWGQDGRAHCGQPSVNGAQDARELRILGHEIDRDVADVLVA
jgi:hypothetical protein